MRILESRGTNCSNCKNAGIKDKCNNRCLNSSIRPNWEPNNGVEVNYYDVWLCGKGHGICREVVRKIS